MFLSIIFQNFFFVRQFFYYFVDFFFRDADYKEMIRFVKPAPIDEPLTKKQQKQLAGMKKEGPTDS